MPRIAYTLPQFAAVHNPFQHFAFFAGIASGKTFTGSHFAIKMIREHPNATGFIGANTYDQLSQATLREFFYWLEEYRFDFVIDRRPPSSWGYGRTLKDYNNTMHVKNPRNGKVTLIFTRVLTDGNPLRGIEFTWYWLDESRDTPQNTHDIVLGRLRESAFSKGLVTTTTNGEDWTYKRFCLGKKTGIYGSMHVKTYENVKHGIISQNYYDTLLASYSPLMAMQELDALHVNVLGGKAYYSASDQNRQTISPWGDTVPSRDRPLIVGCDFNFNPSPCVWMVGQVGPSIWSADGKTYYGDCIHWFDEVSGTEMSTPDMTIALLSRYPDFFYRIYGDASGGVGTTSNAGETDYHQISNIMSEGEQQFSIDYYNHDEKQNPKVRSRVENMCALFRNALGEIRQTYNPVTCPLFDGDIKMVGWKETTLAGRGRLDSGGDPTRTHATDGAGYAVYKLFPPTKRGAIIESVESKLRAEHGLVVRSAEREAQETELYNR